MKNKKGFTLVELLAVIVLLGLLAILITPKITETLKKQKREIFTTSVEGIVDTISRDIADDSSISTDMSQYRAYEFDVNKLYLIVEDEMSKDESIQISGKIKNGEGRVVVTDIDKIALAITDGKYCAKKSPTERDIVVTEMNAEDKCELEDGVFTEGSSCFIYEENVDGTLTITGYDYDNPSCSKDLVIPNRINAKTVTKINEGAFFDYDRSKYRLVGVYKHDFKDESGNIIDTIYIDELYEELPLGAEISYYYLGVLDNSILETTNAVTENIKPSILGEENMDNYSVEKMDIQSGLERYCYDADNDIETQVELGYKNTSEDDYEFCFVRTGYYELTNIYKFTSLDLSKNYNITEIPNLLLPGSTLKTLKLGSSITSVGISAFENNIISTLNLSSNMISIGDSSFYDNNIEVVELEKMPKLDYIGSYAFGYNNISSVSFSKNTNLKYIGESAFDENYISSLSFENATSLEYIGDYAFDYNYASGEINLLDSKNLQYLGDRSFRTNIDGGFSRVYLPSNITFIGDNIFEIFGDCGAPSVHVSKETNVTYDTIMNTNPRYYEFEDEDEDYYNFYYTESICR